LGEEKRRRRDEKEGEDRKGKERGQGRGREEKGGEGRRGRNGPRLFGSSLRPWS